VLSELIELLTIPLAEVNLAFSFLTCSFLAITIYFFLLFATISALCQKKTLPYSLNRWSKALFFTTGMDKL
jgi:hypothetical protein